MRKLTAIRTLAILLAASFLLVNSSKAQTAPDTTSAPPAGSTQSVGHHHTLAERIQHLQDIQQKIQTRINSGKLTGDKLTKAQDRLAKVQERLSKLQAEQNKSA